MMTSGQLNPAAQKQLDESMANQGPAMGQPAMGPAMGPAHPAAHMPVATHMPVAQAHHHAGHEHCVNRVDGNPDGRLMVMPDVPAEYTGHSWSKYFAYFKGGMSILNGFLFIQFVGLIIPPIGSGDKWLTENGGLDTNEDMMIAAKLAKMFMIMCGLLLMKQGILYIVVTMKYPGFLPAIYIFSFVQYALGALIFWVRWKPDDLVTEILDANTGAYLTVAQAIEADADISELGFTTFDFLKWKFTIGTVANLIFGYMCLFVVDDAHKKPKQQQMEMVNAVSARGWGYGYGYGI